MTTNNNNQPNNVPVRERNLEEVARLAQNSPQGVAQAADSIHALRTEADRTSSLLGFGRRIWVPADEVHVVVGHGMHISQSSTKSEVFGQSAGKTSQYWLNPRTKVIKLKTISFTVPLVGHNNEGIEALDSNKVSFKLWAHAVAQLNPLKAEVAARRIGQDTQGLVRTITQVAMSQLVEAAATLPLGDIIANRQSLAKKAFGEVNTALGELGYDLSVLTVTNLAGDAYTKLVTQAESRVSKETTITINKEQLAEKEDVEIRQQREGQIEAETKQKRAAIEAETTEKLVATERAKQKAMLEKVGLDKELNEAEVEKAASLKRKEAEYRAEIRALEARKEHALELEKTEAEAKRMALAQVRKIERDAELTEADAERLRRQELAQAERAKEIALLKESETAEALRMQAEAEAQALEIQTAAQTRTELARAEADARATEQRAVAAKTRAEATRAEAAAAGLAEAEVEQARVAVAEKQVQVTRAEGLAAAEVAMAQAKAEAEKVQKLREVEINAQKALKELDISAQQQLADLYQAAPALVELEKMKLQLAHEETIAQIRAEASIKAFEAIAPGIKINVFGNGGQMTDIMNNIMMFSQGMNVMSEEVPLIGRVMDGVSGQLPGGDSSELGHLMPMLGRLQPYLADMAREVDPRVFSTLKIADVVERLTPVVAGEEDLMMALTKIKNDASFRVIGDLPIGHLLGLLGLHKNGHAELADGVSAT